MTSGSTSTRRYLQLLGQMRTEFVEANGTEHGFVTWVAKELGRSQGYISQVMGGHKAVGAKSIREAAKRRGLSEAWFYESGSEPPESHVEPIDEHPAITRAREVYPEWVIAAVPQHFHHRDGKFTFRDLVEFLEPVYQSGREALDKLNSQIGPPKRTP